jgi:DNA repair exonuclease SbcCD ATPase subunit
MSIENIANDRRVDTSEFVKLKEQINNDKVRRDLLRSELKLKVDLEKQLSTRFAFAQKSIKVIQEVGIRTQSNLEYHIANLVNMSLSAVLSDPPEFTVKFETRRNQTECDLLLDGQKPVDTVGGGVLDILSFALRLAFWTLRKNRPVMILDEPFKFLSADLQARAGEMLKEISESINLQIIMVSHAEDINNSASKTFIVKKVGDVSVVKEI